ncbi:hypothetical protein GCM10018787_03650 [Streptomyces thermodiastaticus]|nr:hypothetical protein GCM10018787_03650 [Streptomyces thermodiastaticus]
MARTLPALLRSAEAATAAAGDDETRHKAVLVRADALLLAGKYLTQVRQCDLAYQALAEGIRLGRESGSMLTAATGVVGLCWLFLRQDRFDECAHLAAATAEAIEPKLSTAPLTVSWPRGENSTCVSRPPPSGTTSRTRRGRRAGWRPPRHRPSARNTPTTVLTGRGSAR